MKRLPYLAFIFLYLVASALGALDFQIPEALDISGFGTILADQMAAELPGKPYETGPFYGRTPRSDIVLTSANPDIKVPASGTVIYVQAEAPLNTVFSFPLGGALSILHPESYISLISGLNAEQSIKSSKQDTTRVIGSLAIKKEEMLSGGSGSGVYPPNCFGLRLFDARNSLWVNPIFLASWIQDRTSPVIRGARLTKSDGGRASFDLGAASKDRRITCVQGSYRIYVDAFDTITPGARNYSAPYRVLVILDGKSVVDASFMAAGCSEDGLSFLGTAAPSGEALATDGAYNVGQLTLTRGEHELQLQVSDYAGNRSTMKTLIIVY